MNFDGVDSVEAVWVAINLFAAGVIFGNAVDAVHRWRNNIGAGRPHEIQARANLRRELVLLYIVAVLILIALPALGRPGDTPLTPYLVLFISVAVAIALNSVLDRLTRRTLDRLLWASDEANRERDAA